MKDALKTCIILLWLCSAISLSAQIPRSRINFAFIGILYGNSINSDEALLLEERITDNLVEFADDGSYSIVSLGRNSGFLQNFPFGQNILSLFDDSNLRQQLRGIIAGKVDRIQDKIHMDIHMYNMSNGDLLIAVDGDYPSLRTATIQSRQLIQRLLGLEEQHQDIAQNTELQEWNPNPQLATLIGKWRGESGDVTIYQNGSGNILLSPSETMLIKVNVHDNVIRVLQDEPNSPKFYDVNFSYSIATQIVDLARPTFWEFHLSSDNKSLIGRKFASNFFIEDGKISRVDNTYFLETTWLRIN